MAVIGVFLFVPPALAPPAGERVFFRNGDNLNIAWHFVDRNEMVLILRDGREMVEKQLKNDSSQNEVLYSGNVPTPRESMFKLSPASQCPS